MEGPNPQRPPAGADEVLGAISLKGGRPTSLILGIVACTALAIGARSMAGLIGLGIETAFALAFGILASIIPPVRGAAMRGAEMAARVLLRVGVALLGARLTLDHVLDVGAGAIVIVALVVVVGLALGLLLGHALSIPGRLGPLIAAGMAICGNSAILALSPIIRAAPRETAYAVSVITLFGLAGVLALPVIGTALGMSDATFGTWAGLAVNDTAQVVAAGYAYAPAAGDQATIVKLTRNLAIAPVIIGAALAVPHARSTSGRAVVGGAIPFFVVGFVALAGARSVGILDTGLPVGATVADVLNAASGWCILIALAGVGLRTDLAETLRIGARPLALGAIVWILIAVAALTLAVAQGRALL